MTQGVGKLASVAQSDLDLWWVPTDGTAKICISAGLARRLGIAGDGSVPPDAFLAQIDAEDQPRLLTALAQAAPNGPIVDLECRVRGAAHEEILRLRGAYCTPYGMDQPFLVGFADFVTPARARAAELAASERRLRLAVDAAQLGLWEWDRLHDRIVWSDRVYEIFDVPRQVTPSFQTFLERLHTDDRDRVLEAVLATFEGQQAEYAIDFRVCPPGRELIWLHARGDVIRDEAGEATHMAGCVLDISDRKAAEEHAHRRAEEADAAAQTKDAFLAAVSHEVRTPLTAILGFAELIGLNAGSDGVRDQAKAIERSARRLKRMLDDVLTQARISADAITLHLAPTTTSVILARVEPVARIMAETRNLTFRTTIDEDCPVAADLDRVEQILLNLVSNAAKFTNRGAIELRAAAAKGWASISVRDSGTGIDPSFLPYVFEPFRHESSGYRRQLGNTGLGLSIAQGLAKRMGGEIAVESTTGKGSTFTLRLPCLELDASAPVRPPDTVASSAAPLCPPTRPRILLLEDDEMIRNLMQRILAESADITATATPEAAIAAADAQPFDLFMFDFDLKAAQTGADVLVELRSRAKSAHVPAICVTANYDARNPTHMLEAGFAEVLTKPFSPDDLREAVNRHTLRF